jgi:transcriptional regulator with XRE-family HTH domain
MKTVKQPNNLRKFRNERGLLQKDVARLLGLQCEDRISHWEKGYRVPSLKNLMKLCALYQAPLHELYPYEMIDN